MEAIPVAPVAPRRRKVALALALFGVAFAWWFYGHPPTTGTWYPPCLFHSLTGLNCPGCGATRAVYALLHGRIGEALHQNALAVIALPFLGFATLKELWRWSENLPPPTSQVPDRWAVRFTLLLAPAVIVFAILRNLPWPPFDWLAPY